MDEKEQTKITFSKKTALLGFITYLVLVAIILIIMLGK